MKKKLFFAAVALVALASCTVDDFVGEDTSLTTSNVDDAISFNLNVPTTTRADQVGSAAATTLGNTFYVYGIKTESTDGAGNVGTGHTVFKNYVVKYDDNTAYTTTSNTKDWEYVGKALTTNEAANINANDGTGAQTIKYWDYAAPDYTFYAFSASSADIDAATPKVTVVKNQTVTGTGKEYDNGYTVTLASGADLDKLFFSERVNIAKSAGTDRTAKNTYGGNVTFRFHNAATKVRVAMYETIDGYSVKINKFTVDNDAAVDDDSKPAFNDMVNDNTTNFAANLKNSKGGDAGTLTVTYYDNSVTATENQPILSFAQTDGINKVLTLGTNLIDVTSLATSIASPTYDTGDDPATTTVNENGAYTSVFPNKDNAQNLKLKLSYTLTAPGTGETITITDATAEIPADYLKWKPGFAYTYIFKISANSNGSSGTPGTDPAGLYPITFDAVATVAEDGTAEYITTVSEPSITTFGYNKSSKKYITGGNDYPAGCDVYATFIEGSSVMEPTLGTSGAQHVHIYRVSSSDATNFPVNEASVAEALAESPTGTAKISVTDVTTDGVNFFSGGAPSVVSAVPGEDGVDISIKAVKLGGVVSGTYAIEYEASAAWTGSYKKVYKIITVQ